MNKIITLILGIIAVLIIGGVILYSVRNQTTTVSDDTTPAVQTTTTVINTNPTKQSGVPILVTSSKVAPSDTTVIVISNVNPNGAFTNYWYEYGKTASLGSRTANQSVGSGYVSIPTPGYITGLTKDTTYYFKLVAENQNGKVVGTQYSFKTTLGTSAPVGSVPSVKTISASGIDRTTANLNGEVTPNKAETEYWFEYGTTADLGDSSALVAIGNSNTKLSGALSLSGLSPLTTYYFRINAQNQFGTVNGTILNFKTKK